MTEHDRDESFTVHYTHSAPRELVFECMTTPEHLAHFWGPTGTHTPLSAPHASARCNNRRSMARSIDASAAMFIMQPPGCILAAAGLLCNLEVAQRRLVR